MLAPGGNLQLSSTALGTPETPPGIVTEGGGAINIFTNKNIDIGISRIFSLAGGNITIWSDKGNIAAGSSSKTIQSARPTRVLIDPESADVKNDLGGLATGGGIGTKEDEDPETKPSDVDLIAPLGSVDAGDAGITSSGNLNIAAQLVLNASNISVTGSSAGAAPPTVAAPSATSLIAAANTTATTNNSPAQSTNKDPMKTDNVIESLSIFSVEVLGYGGGDDDQEDENLKKKRLKKP
jgi:filamentous hemagglutinin